MSKRPRKNLQLSFSKADALKKKKRKVRGLDSGSSLSKVW